MRNRVQDPPQRPVRKSPRSLQFSPYPNPLPEPGQLGGAGLRSTAFPLGRQGTGTGFGAGRATPSNTRSGLRTAAAKPPRVGA